MKKLFNNRLFIFMLGVLVGSPIVAYAAVTILSSQVDYSPKDNTWNVENVESALDDLYDMARNNGGNTSGFIGYAFNYDYTGTYQTFNAPATGEYKIELWGAQGGSAKFNPTYLNGGYGAYTSGVISLDRGDLLYLYVGEAGHDYIALANNNGGWNGGGNIHYPYSNNGGDNTGTGGGATDIRIISGDWNDENSLRSRIMVAGAGGGASNNKSGAIDSAWNSNGGSAGGLIGNIRTISGTNSKNYYGYGGTQTSGGTSIGYSSHPASGNGGFGFGGYGSYVDEGAGGGSGWYGGGGVNVDGGGGGGSSYISGHTGCVAVTSVDDTTPKSGCDTGTTDNDCSKSPYEYQFINTIMIDGLGYNWTNTKGDYVGQPQPDGSVAAGHSGNGYARITYIG